MSKSGSTTKVDISGIEKAFSESNLKKKQAAFASRVALDMRKHVPEDEGTLRDSEPMNSDYENGQIIWNTPYAKIVLNADHVLTTKNKNATPQWPEVTKQEKLQDWKAFAAALMQGNDSVSVGGAR